MNMLSGAKYLKDGHPVMVDKDGEYKFLQKKSLNQIVFIPVVYFTKFL